MQYFNYFENEFHPSKIYTYKNLVTSKIYMLITLKYIFPLFFIHNGVLRNYTNENNLGCM